MKRTPVRPGAPPARKTRLQSRHRTKGGRNSLPGKLTWLRTRPCLICGATPSEVHHDRKMGSRADDRRTVPLCQPYGKPGHHREGPDSVQVLGRAGFEARHGISMDVETVRYHEEWEARHAMDS